MMCRRTIFFLVGFMIMLLHAAGIFSSIVYAENKNGESIKLSIDVSDQYIVSGGPILVTVNLKSICKQSLNLVDPNEWGTVVYVIKDSDGKIISSLKANTGDIEITNDYITSVIPGEALVLYDNLTRLFKSPLLPGCYEVVAVYSIPEKVDASFYGPIKSAPKYFQVRASTPEDRYVYQLIVNSMSPQKEVVKCALNELQDIARLDVYKGVHSPYLTYHIGCALHKLESYDKALAVLLRAADQFKNNKFYYIAIAREIGNVYIHQNNYDKAAEWWASMPSNRSTLSIADTLRSKARKMRERTQD